MNFPLKLLSRVYTCSSSDISQSYIRNDAKKVLTRSAWERILFPPLHTHTYTVYIVHRGNVVSAPKSKRAKQKPGHPSSRSLFLKLGESANWKTFKTTKEVELDLNWIGCFRRIEIRAWDKSEVHTNIAFTIKARFSVAVVVRSSIFPLSWNAHPKWKYRSVN